MLFICPSCNRTYASYANYCNYCEVDLTDTNILTRFVENPNSQRLKFVANCLAFAVGATLLTAAIFFIFAKGAISELIVSGCILGASALYPLHILFLRRSRRKSILPAKELMRLDTRKPVLFLRSFDRDGAAVVNENLSNFWSTILPWHSLIHDYSTFEERLADILFHLGPPVAIGDPRYQGKLPDIGAARMYVQEGWQAVVETLCQQARYIVVMLDTTAGVKWEISVALDAHASARLFIVPPLQGFLSRRAFKKNYSRLQQQFSFLPNYQSGLVAVLFPTNSVEGRVLLSTKKSPTPKERLLKIEEAVLEGSDKITDTYACP